MDKQDDKQDDDQNLAAKKPEAAKPVVKPAPVRWPGQNPNAGFKNSKSLQGRRPVGRGAARGR